MNLNPTALKSTLTNNSKEVLYSQPIRTNSQKCTKQFLRKSLNNTNNSIVKDRNNICKSVDIISTLDKDASKDSKWTPKELPNNNERREDS